MDTAAFLRELTGLPFYQGQVTHVEEIPPREALHGRLDRPLPREVDEVLAAAGVEELYYHQAQAINAARRGENVVVATPAASGKSLCYNVPVLEALLEDRTACALYLFPTKALSQDQARGLEALLPSGRRLPLGVFDGDTPSHRRADIRRRARIVITNPDMLHLGILPHHRSWHRFLARLRYVVIDEAHVYRGVFGSHVANVLRRLRRLCQRFGARPQFILSSATIANPDELARTLVGLPFTVVDRDGSPSAGRDFVLWNPPMLDMAKGSRRSSNTEAALLLAELVQRRARAIAFVRSRRTAELVYMYARDHLRLADPAVASRLAPYRAGYMAEDRRRIESDLFQGRLLGVAATSALELGIDVGDLEAVILTGYPGSVAATWQEAGRAGRRGQRSLAVLVARDDPLDQYIVRHPEALFGRPFESARLDPDNPYILKPHLLCAVYEAPLTAQDRDLFGPQMSDYALELEAQGLLVTRSGRRYLAPEVEYPAQDVNIRSATGRFYTLVEKETGIILETVEEFSAFLQLHPGGIYLHQGESYLVTELDLDSRTAYATRTDAPYYTQAQDYTETRVLRVFRSREAGRTRVYLGAVAVTTTVVGFKRKAHLSDEVLGEEYVDLPPQRFETVALWFDLPPDVLRSIAEAKEDLAGGLHALEHAAIGVLPLFAMCDRNDIGGVSTPLHPDTGRPQVFIHDGHPGGVGIAEHGYRVVEDLWRATFDVIAHCPCEVGCPGCIQSPKCGSNNQPLDKAVALRLLRAVLGE